MAIPLRTRVIWKMLSLAGGTSIMQLPPDQVRAASEKRKRAARAPGAWLVTGKRAVGVEVTDRTGPVVDGVPIGVRVYRPSGPAPAALPLIVNFHGGGFVAGGPVQSEWWCSHVARDARAVVVSVDYRLAPEHPYPVPGEDCYAATVWAAEHAADLGSDGSRLAVMGDSAGGTLAAVVAMMCRDRGGPAVALQVLMYPAVDLAGEYPSEDENAHAPILAKADLRADSMYCPDHTHEPYASPLFGNHEGLPHALIQTAQFDPLRDQGPAYAAALGKAGVDVRLTNYVEGVHGYISVPGIAPCARQALGEAVASLRAALAPR